MSDTNTSNVCHEAVSAEASSSKAIAPNTMKPSQSGISHEPDAPTATDEAGKGTLPLNEAIIHRCLQNSFMLQLKFGLGISMVEQLIAQAPDTVDAMNKDIQIITWMSVLLSPSVDPRELVTTRYDAPEWVRFLHQTGIAVFPWEFGAYVRIEDALKHIGVSPKGGLKELICMKKHALQESLSHPYSYCRMLLSSFRIEDNIKAQRWLVLPDETVAKNLYNVYCEWKNRIDALEAIPPSDVNELTATLLEADTLFALRSGTENLLQGVTRDTGLNFLQSCVEDFENALNFNQTTFIESRGPDPTQIRNTAVDKGDRGDDGGSMEFKRGSPYNPYYIWRLLTRYGFAQVAEWVKAWAARRSHLEKPQRMMRSFIYRIERQEIREREFRL